MIGPRQIGFTALLLCAAAVGGCASGSGAAFSAAARNQAQDQAVANDQTDPAHGGLAGRQSANPAVGGGRVIYVSGNVLLPMHGAGATVGQGRGLGGSASLIAAGRSAGGTIAAGGARIGVTSDPLGALSGAAQTVTGVTEAAGDPFVGIGKGKPVLGRKGAGGVLGGAGKAAGSLIGSGSQDAGSGGNLLTGVVAGGRHKKLIG